MTVKQELARKAEKIKAEEKHPDAEQEERYEESDGERKSIRLLRSDEIECRVSTIKANGLSLLLFKDARVDQKILDETFTPFGWKRTHQIIDGNLYCTVEIWDESKQQWIAKQDVGTTSYSEKEKGQASDSFKRACFNWGVGRELYTAPFIWIPAENANIQQKGDRYVTYERFSVQSIAYNEQREIIALTIVNGKGIPVYMMNQGRKTGQGTNQNRGLDPANRKSGTKDEQTAEEGKAQGTGAGQHPEAKQESERRQHPEADPKQGNSGVTARQLLLLEKELKRTGVSIETVLSRYKIQSLDQMTPEIYTKALNGLKKSKTLEAA